MNFWVNVITGTSRVVYVIIKTPKWWEKEAPERTWDMIGIIEKEIRDYTRVEILEEATELVWSSSEGSMIYKYKAVINESILKQFTRWLKTRNPITREPTGYGTTTLYLKNVDDNMVYVHHFTKKDGELCLSYI